MPKPITIGIVGGHRIEVRDNWTLWIIDASGDGRQVNPEGFIVADQKGFVLPLMDGTSTFATPEEALLVAALLDKPILGGTRRFRVTQTWRD